MRLSSHRDARRRTSPALPWSGPLRSRVWSGSRTWRASGSHATCRGSWSLRLLADELVRLEVVGAISHETVRRTLKKNDLKPWLCEQWCLVPTADPAFVWQMEDVLALYERPHDSTRPVVCLNGTSRQLLADARPPLPRPPVAPPATTPSTSGAGWPTSSW